MANPWTTAAVDSYSAASILVDDGRWRSAVSRAYFAVYARVTERLVDRGVTMPLGWEGPAHAKLSELIEEKLVTIGATRWRVADHVRTLYNYRLIADYRPSEPVENADALTAMLLMGQVFHLTKGN